jgi:hypothetical protein
MLFRLEIEMDGEAFSEDLDGELTRTCVEAVGHVLDQKWINTWLKLKDSNGNTCGRVRVDVSDGEPPTGD